MRTRKPKPEPDIEPEYDFHDAGLNPHAERYREAERQGRIRLPGSAAADLRRAIRHFVGDWRATAESWADPEIRARLLADEDTPPHDVEL